MVLPSKEVENNNILRLNVYSKQYVSRRNGSVEDHMEEVVVLDVLESCSCVCIYIRLC